MDKRNKCFLRWGFSFLILSICLYLMYILPQFVENSLTASSPDLILDNLPVFDLTYIFVYFFILIVLSIAFLVLSEKFEIAPYIIVLYSFLMIVRQFFLNLTTLGFPQNGIMPNFPSFLNYFVYHNDLFFSGHVAFPFLAYLIFYENKYYRYFYLAMTFCMGVIVLLMHVHYSIDVFAAPFITYGCFKFAEKYFGWFKYD